MKTGPHPEPKFKIPKLSIITALGLLIVVIILASWYTVSHKSVEKTSSAIPAGWSEYKATNYGFKFDYPETWGTPKAGQEKGKTGSHYQIIFVADSKSKTKSNTPNVSINMDSSDYITNSCSSPNCKSSKFTLTDQVVKTNIRFGSKSFVKHDSTSYALLSNINASKLSTLTEVQIVNLPSIKVSAVVALYSNNTNGDCPEGKFAITSKTGCITQIDYSTIDQVLKSLTQINKT